MSITRLKRLAASAITSEGTNIPQTLYQNTDLSAIATTLVVCNTTENDQTYRVGVNSTPAFQPTTQWIAYDSILKANDTEFLNMGIKLDQQNGSYLLVSGSSVGLVFSAFGSEVSSQDDGDYTTKGAAV